MFSAGSYTARPTATAYVTYPAAAVQAYTYTPVVSAPPSAVTGYATSFQTAAVPRQDFSAASAGYPYVRPAAAAYYTPPTISAPPTVAAKPIPGAATTVPSKTTLILVVLKFL